MIPRDDLVNLMARVELPPILKIAALPMLQNASDDQIIAARRIVRALPIILAIAKTDLSDESIQFYAETIRDDKK